MPLAKTNPSGRSRSSSMLNEEQTAAASYLRDPPWLPPMEVQDKR
jgi:hypothetical protein